MLEALWVSLIGVAGAAFSGWLLQRAWAASIRYRRRFDDMAYVGLREFFLFVDPAQLWAAQLWACAGLGLLTGMVSGAVAPAMAVMVGVMVLPRFVLANLRRRRLVRFERQLPDFLMSLAAALRAGAGLQVAVRQIVTQSPAPLSQEMGQMLQEQRMGVSLEAALDNLAVRMPGQGLALIVSALRVATHSGGNLSETLERIAATLRARLYMQGRILALTAQGRLQAWVMAALPILMALVLDYLDPHAMALLWHTPVGWAVMAVVGVLETAGLLLIRRIVAIDV